MILDRVPPGHKSSGNEACVEIAESVLAEVKKGKVRYIGVVMAENAGHADMLYGGSTGCEFAANWGYDRLKESLSRPMATGSAAAVLNVDHARYDLKRAPISFDFAPWLIDREMVRLRFGAPGPLKVAFTEPAADRVMTDNNLRMLEAVLMPMVEMIGGVIDAAAAGSWQRSEFYCNRPVVEAAQAGETVPILKPRPLAFSQVAKLVAGRPPVTITLRETTYDSPRNSRTEEWLRFARDLRSAGERVIFLRDTRKADEPLADFEICPPASRDLHTRLALYEQAKCNFFVSNGPVTLAMFSEAPYVFLNEVLDYADSSNPTESWTLYHGTPPGEQVPWVKPNQRIVWKSETYENMHAAWNDFNAPKQAAA